MASIRKRSNSWQVRIQRVDGYVSKTFKIHSDAVAWARNIESQLDIGIELIKLNSKITLGEMLVRYRDEVTYKKKYPEIEQYRIEAWLRHKLSNKPFYKIKGMDIAQWRDERLACGRSPNTLRLELSIISNLYTVAKSEWGFEGLNNPTNSIKLPKLPTGRVRRLKSGELERITSSSESQYLKLIVTVAVETGMRRGEIAAMEWKHINFQKRTIHIPYTKNGESREVPLSMVVINLLESLKADNKGLIFDVTPHAISVAFTRACKRAKVQNLHFHDLRHEAISRFFEKGLSIAEVATISGHKTWAMLRRYTHLSAEKIAEKL